MDQQVPHLETSQQPRPRPARVGAAGTFKRHYHRPPDGQMPTGRVHSVAAAMKALRFTTGADRHAIHALDRVTRLLEDIMEVEWIREGLPDGVAPLPPANELSTLLSQVSLSREPPSAMSEYGRTRQLTLPFQ